MSAITYGTIGFPASASVLNTTFVRGTATERSSTRLRLTRRGRAVITALVSVPLAIALISIGLNGGGATATSGDASVSTITVEAGESLWAVAAQIAPEASTADVVADLIAVNGLTSAELLPGQLLVVPDRYVD